jgi:hypothetical protein
MRHIDDAPQRFRVEIGDIEEVPGRQLCGR